MPRDERAPRPGLSRAASAEDADLELLAAGRLDVLGRLPRASNATLLARVERGGREALAVYKPRAGERPLWDFPDGTLCVREVAAYLVARTLGWPSVPPTVLRDGPLGVGSVQRFVEHDPAEHALSLVERFPEEFRRIAAFDVVVNNADRKAGHCLLGTDGRVHVVDHGVCFAEPPKLRTVLWDFVGEPLPPAIVPDLERLAEEVRGGELGSRLASLLSPEEAAAVGRRAERLARAATFPGPGAERPYPWPLL